MTNQHFSNPHVQYIFDGNENGDTKSAIDDFNTVIKTKEEFGYFIEPWCLGLMVDGEKDYLHGYVYIAANVHALKQYGELSLCPPGW